MTKQNDNQEETLLELIREANGTIKDLSRLLRELRNESSQAREILPGLKEKALEESLVKRFDQKLDVYFNDGVDMKLREVYKYLDEMLGEIEQGTIIHFSQMINLLYKVLKKLTPETINQASAIDLITVINDYIESRREQTNNTEYKFFDIQDGDTKKGYGEKEK